jgi:cell division protein FtsQ
VTTVETPPRPPIDPKLRDRRVAVIRAQGRRRLYALVAVLGVFVVVGLAWVILHSAILDVDRVDARDPGGHVSAASLVAASGIHDGQAMFFLDLGQVARRVERLPWVAHVSVQRDYPGTVHITVTDRTPIAYVTGTNGAALIDRTGRVLAVGVHAPTGLFELTGVLVPTSAGTKLVPSGLATFAVALPKGFATLVARIELAGSSVTTVLTDGREVRFGAWDQIAAKVAAAQAVMADLGTSTVHYIDVRVPTAPATG